MSGTLFVVATPIGNLEDVTLRALRVLREADLIAAEDTRRSARLLAHHAIRTPVVSFHQHNIRARLPQLLDRLRSGRSVALVTDAGTPGISDPGVELVQAAIEAGVPIEPLPGASAALAAAVASGFPMIPLTVLGFPPSRSKDRKAWLERVASLSHTVTFFESPLRISRTLLEGSTLWGKRQISVARELTKIHQEFLRGSAETLSEQLRSARGEITVVLGPIEVEQNRLNNRTEASEVVAYFCHITENSGLTRRAAIGETARHFRLPQRVVYQAIEQAKNLAERPNSDAS